MTAQVDISAPPPRPTDQPPAGLIGKPPTQAILWAPTPWAVASAQR